MATINKDFWIGKRVLVTGHTGFKGSWLCLWLQAMRSDVFGLALSPPTQPALFQEAHVDEGMSSFLGDVRDFEVVSQTLAKVQPEIVIHMAAQPLVRRSYQHPVETYSTNVMGTVHVLEAARRVGSVKAIVNVTTDKCYENREWVWGYRENEPMGGHDPYSSSKGCSELVTRAYRSSFYADSGIALASARAGNVIGGGDWAEDRLIPDILRSFEKSEPVVIRNPQATRPWQHVLEPLSGYLLLAERLYNEGQAFADAWNFGPTDEDARPVHWIADYFTQAWGDGAYWIRDGSGNPHEANYLKLDSSKARAKLGWYPRWSLAKALDRILDWHRTYVAGANMTAVCLAQIDEYSSVPIDKQ